MKIVIAIAAVHLKRTFRQRAAFFWIFVGPLLFMTFFGLVFREAAPRATVVDLFDADSNPVTARALAVALRLDKIEARGVTAINPQRWTLEIPAGTSATLAAGEGVALTLHSPEEEQTNSERRLSFRATKALFSVFLQANPADLPADATDEQIAERLSAARSLRVERADIGMMRRNVTAGFQRSVPAYLVMFVFMNLLVSGAAISEERAAGQMRRIFMAPLRRPQLVAGILLSRVTIGWIQTFYMLGLGILLFKIRWADHPFTLFGFLTLFALCSASLGMVIGTLFKDPDKCEAAAVWAGVILSPLGGLWWPLEVVGPTMRTIGQLVPTGWAMESVNAMLAFGDGPADVAVHAGGFVALTLVSLYVVARRLKP